MNNKHSLAHVINISVINTKSVNRENVSAKALKVIENGLEGQIPIDAGETKVYPDFLVGPVIYIVKIRLNSDEVETVKFSPTAIEVPKAQGAYLTINIEQDGELSGTITYLYQRTS